MTSLTPDHTLLGLLAIQPRHGYDLLESFRESSHLGRIWNMSTSQVYAVLKRLEREGSITGYEVESEHAPPRTEYVLTPSGQAALEVWLSEPSPSASIRRIRVEFVSRLYISRELGRPTEPIITRQRAACIEEEARLNAIRVNADSSIERLILDLQIAQIRAVLDWLAQAEEVLHSNARSKR